MPLDALPVGRHGATDHAMFRERREKVAALWRDVPAEQFVIWAWKKDRSCGTIACALGWLAIWQYDGWHMNTDDLPVRNAHNNPIDAAVQYFGLSEMAAMTCFSGSASLYGPKINEITGADVGRVLLTLPYYAQMFAHRDR